LDQALAAVDVGDHDCELTVAATAATAAKARSRSNSVKSFARKTGFNCESSCWRNIDSRHHRLSGKRVEQERLRRAKDGRYLSIDSWDGRPHSGNEPASFGTCCRQRRGDGIIQVFAKTVQTGMYLCQTSASLKHGRISYDREMLQQDRAEVILLDQPWNKSGFRCSEVHGLPKQIGVSVNTD